MKDPGFAIVLIWVSLSGLAAMFFALAAFPPL